ncbi:MAG: hypothetical protein KAV00_15840 [Phycisphaerae bacterium]|nr:hypothetical protein [Phycisphaerae bacterium]
MAVDIKKVLASLKERKETMLVWGLGAVVLCLGVFLLIGFMRGASLPPSLEVVVKRKKPLKSKEEITEEAIAELKETQKIPPFIDYQDILTKNLFIQSRMVSIEGEVRMGTGGFDLKGIWKETGKIVAFIQDPEGKAYPVVVGQTIGTSEVKVVAIDFKSQSVTLMAKGWEKSRVIRMAREEMEKVGDRITFKPGEKKKEIEKQKGATEEEARKAIASAKRAISKADSSIVDAVGTAADTSEATEKRDEAKKKLKEAQEAYLTKDYAITRNLALEAKNLAQEAVELAEEAIEEEEKKPEEGEEELRKDLEKEAGEDEREEEKEEYSPKGEAEDEARRAR